MKQEHSDYRNCTGDVGNVYNMGVIRDTWRSLLIEKHYKEHSVYTVNQCVDEVRYGDNGNSTNVNRDFNSKYFLRHAKVSSWYFHEFHVDYVRIPHNYIVSAFGKNIVTQLIKIVDAKIL